MRGQVGLGEAVTVLRKSYGPPERLPTEDPFALILWENVAYLAAPARRREAFVSLEKAVGLSPAAIRAAKRAALARVTSHGILGDTFVEKLRECARIALDECGGDLDAVVRRPLAEARKILRSFPGIGEPGAEKVLLFSGRQALLAPDSNALRVLVRLGLVLEGKSYARTYAASRQAAGDLPQTVKAMQEAHLLLQRHGQTVCRRTAPRCPICPLVDVCAHARRTGGLPDAGARPARPKRK